jgi:hypothetical protein
MALWGERMVDDQDKPPKPNGTALSRWSLRGLIALVILALLILIWIWVSPGSDRPPADLWQSATTDYNDECDDGCRVLVENIPAMHGDRDGVIMSLTTDPRLDDPIAQWGDCMDTVFTCLNDDTSDTDAERANGLRLCVAESTCPNRCKDRFAQNSTGDLENVSAAFENLFLEENAWCLPQE